MTEPKITPIPKVEITGPFTNGAWFNPVNNGGIATITAFDSIDISHNTLDSSYQGQMVTAQFTVFDTNQEFLSMTASDFRDYVKSELIEKLMEQIVKKNLIEFTSQTDAASCQTHYRARIFAVPDTQVRIIRKANK